MFLIRKGVFVFLFISIFVLPIPLYASQDNVSPQIIVPLSEYNFGKARPGSLVEHTFTLKNKGKAKFVIEKVKIKGPVTATGEKTIEPGQEGKVHQVLDTTKIRGKVEAVTILQTNDPAYPQIELRMIGEVQSAIEFQPIPAVFLAAFRGETKEMALKIINNEERFLEILGIESESKRFKAELQTVKPGKEYKLIVKNTLDASVGRTAEPLLLFTNYSEYPELNLPVNVLILGDVYTFPDIISFNKINLAQLKISLKKSPELRETMGRTILVKRKPGKGKDFQIKLETQIPFIKIKKTPESGSETYRLDVTPILERMKPGKIDTFIRVKTNDKEVPELKIPVVGEVL